MNKENIKVIVLINMEVQNLHGSQKVLWVKESYKNKQIEEKLKLLMKIY